MAPQNTHRVPNNTEHERISALFLGPKAENAAFLSRCFEMIVSGQVNARCSYFPDDDVRRPFTTTISKITLIITSV